MNMNMNMNSFCKPYLLYATECMGLSNTYMRSLRHTWQSAVSHVFNITGEPVNFICSRLSLAITRLVYNT